MNIHQVTISGALGREIANQHPAQKADGARGQGIRKAIAALAGVDESAVELVSGGGQWHVNLPDAEAQAAFHAAMILVREAAKR